MIEKLIYLEGIDPIVFYGSNNTNLDIIKSLFPKLKICVRGDEIKILGEKSEAEIFEKKIELIIEFIQKFNKINPDDFEQLVSSQGVEYLKSKKEIDKDILLFGNEGKPIRARTINQQKFVKEYNKNDMLFAVGPAGTGKTYTAIALAVNAFKNKEVKRIVLVRPAVEAGENLGFLPGDFKEKLDPYLQPLYDALNDMIPSKKLKTLIEIRDIEIAPLAYMRGRTLSDAFVILDEAQNTTNNQLKMFLTRMGKNSKFIITGDITQIDLPVKNKSGLIFAMKILKNIKEISIIEFDSRDIIRHKLVKFIVNAYEKGAER